MNDNKVKALILSHSSELAGAELSMIDLVDYWAKKGWVEPHFIIRRPLREMVPELRKRGWDYTALYYTNWSQRGLSNSAEDIHRNALFNTKAVFAIERVIQELKPDIVITNTIVSPWAALAAHYQQVPHVWFVREYGDVDHKHIFEVGREGMLQDIGTLSNLVVTNSQTLATDISPYIDKDKITTLYNPFDLDKMLQRSQDQAKNPFKDDSNLKVIITGRIAPTKGQPDAAEAIGKLNRAGHGAELCIIGVPSEPSDAESLNKIIAEYDIADKVQLLGKQSNPFKFIKFADVGITASKKEAFGRVTFEYMALARPVVGTDAGATPELVDHNKTGYLFRSGDTEQLYKYLLKYAEDKNLAQEHGAAALQKAKKMMAGQHNAQAAYEKIHSIVNDKNRQKTQPVNYTHRWLEYPSIAEQYIKDTDAISLHKIIYRRTRHAGKLTYLWVSALFGKDKKKV